MNALFRQLFSEPTQPAGKVSRADLLKSLKRLIGGLVLATAYWMSTDLAVVVNDGTADAGYYIALIYAFADLVQLIARKAKEPDEKESMK
jgi:hypothetical protein